MIRLPHGLLVLAFAAHPSIANACRAYVPVAERLKMAHAGNYLTGVATARVVRAEFIRPRDGDMHMWKAVFKLDRLLLGNSPAGTATYVRGGGSAACDEGYKKPRPGDIWVVYLSTTTGRPRHVWAAHPLAVARSSDPRIRDKLRQ